VGDRRDRRKRRGDQKNQPIEFRSGVAATDQRKKQDQTRGQLQKKESE